MTANRAYAQDLERRLTALEKAFKRKSERRKKGKLPPPVQTLPASPDETKQKQDTLRALRETKLSTEVEKVTI